jgi:hypothetical protein
MKQRAVMSVAVFGSPIYLLVVGPFGVVGIPVVTVLFGGQVWPQLFRVRLFALGCATLGTMIGVYLVAVFWFYGIAGPTGAWAWIGPLVGVIVYVVACTHAAQRPWPWPLVVAVALLSVGVLAMATGVRFES